MTPRNSSPRGAPRPRHTNWTPAHDGYVWSPYIGVIGGWERLVEDDTSPVSALTIAQARDPETDRLVRGYDWWVIRCDDAETIVQGHAPTRAAAVHAVEAAWRAREVSR